MCVLVVCRGVGRDMIDRAVAGDMRDLLVYIDDFDLDEVLELPKRFTSAEWEEILPSWSGRDRSRGLKEWQSTARGRSWQVQGLCARTINKAVDCYMNTVAVPPVVAGDPSKTCNVTEMITQQPDCNFLKTYVLIIHAAYCKFLVPAVEPGLLAYKRVLQYMLSKPVLIKLLRSYRIRFSKLVTKKLIKSITVDFRKWVHEDDPKRSKIRLRLLRELHSDATDDQTQTDLVFARSVLAACLVDYAIGSPDIKNVKPYGLRASRSEKGFKQVSSSVMALTVAALYQAVRSPPDMFEKWVKAPRPNITRYWPKGTIKRFQNFQETFTKYRSIIFQTYETNEGQYMQESAEVKSKRGGASSAAAASEAVDLTFDEDFE